MSSGWTRSIDSRPMRASGSVSMTQSAEVLIQAVVRSGSISETTADGARSRARSRRAATSGGMPAVTRSPVASSATPPAGSSDSAVMIRRLRAWPSP